MKAKILDVAKFILASCRDAGDPITNLKLQKLAYYAEAWFAGIYKDQLTGEKFEAWVHGPVCPKLYGHYKKFGFGPIAYNGDAPNLPKKVAHYLKEVLDAYSRFSAWDLERMTHREAPWLNARRGLKPTESCNVAISFEDMRDYYGRRANET